MMAENEIENGRQKIEMAGTLHYLTFACQDSDCRRNVGDGPIENDFQRTKLSIGIVTDVMQSAVMTKIEYDCRGKSKLMSMSGTWGVRMAMQEMKPVKIYLELLLQIKVC